MKSLVIGGLAMSVSLLSAAQAEQPLPPGRYCGFVDLAHVGIVVYPTQADGRLRVSVSSLWNKEDWGALLSRRRFQRIVLLPTISRLRAWLPATGRSIFGG